MLINICMSNAQFCWIDFFFFLKIYINCCMYMASITWLNVWVNNDIFLKHIFVIIIVIISNVNIYKLCLIISNYVLVLTYYALLIIYFVLVLCIPIIFWTAYRIYKIGHKRKVIICSAFVIFFEQQIRYIKLGTKRSVIWRAFVMLLRCSI